jgi:hydrophobe/amphiphile efflux-3 (HAE3) family protein
VEKFSKAIARFIERRPWWILLLVVLLSGAAAPGLTLLESSTGFESLVSPSSDLWQENARYEEQFGGDSITILLEGRQEDIFSVENLAILEQFEQEFSQDDRYRSIVGPITVFQGAIEEAERMRQELQTEIYLAQEAAAMEAREAAAAMGLSEAEQEQAAEEARAMVLEEYQPQIEQLQLIGEPSLDNPLFIDAVLYDEEGELIPEMQPFIPDYWHALISVTPQGNMPDEEALQASTDIENFFATHPLTDVDVTVIAATKLVNAISTSLSNNIMILLVLALAVMVLVLVVIFRVRWRLLSLLMVGISALWTFGLMGYLSIPLSMATMAVLPILIGLGIDYSIQFHNRYQEELIRSKTVGEAIVNSLSSMFNIVGIALVATIIGFITLYISEVPMIRDFGVALAIGIVLSYLAALFLLHSIVYVADKRAPIKQLRKESWEASGRIERILAKLAKGAIRWALPIFVVALAFGIAGGIVDHWLPRNTNFEELMPQDMTELRELRDLRQIVGSGGEIRFMIEADDAASTEVLNWLQGYQEQALATHPELISVNSPAVLVSEAAGGIIPSQGEIDAILDSTPPLYLEAVLSSDRTMASASFNIEYISLDETQQLLQTMESEADPPAGVEFSPVGSLALGASTVDAVVGRRLTMNLICLGAVFIVLLLVYRRLSTALFIIVPVGAVIAWSSLDMYLIGIPLNPITAVMGVIIIGICTEFMVLLMGRYEEEKKRGLQPYEAMVTALSKMGRAIVTTALTTLGGFGVLIVSDFVMVRDFGIATIIGVFLCLIITIAVMPGIIVWFDNWRGRKLAKL